jgi:hypothetical protein
MARQPGSGDLKKPATVEALWATMTKSDGADLRVKR